MGGQEIRFADYAAMAGDDATCVNGCVLIPVGVAGLLIVDYGSYATLTWL